MAQPDRIARNSASPAVCRLARNQAAVGAAATATRAESNDRNSSATSSQTAQAILRGLRGVDFVAMDLVEVAPPYDVSQITALAGAHLTMDYLCLRALRKE